MKSRVLGLVISSLLFAVKGTLAQTPTISLQAVEINGSPISPSNSVLVKPGDTVEAEIFVSDWTTDDERLLLFQVGVSRTSFISGTTGIITPAGWDSPLTLADEIGCADDSDCPAEFPFCHLIFADSGVCEGLNHDPAQGVFIDQDRADWVFFDSNSGSPFPSIAAVDLGPGPVLRYAAVLFPFTNAQVYSPPPKYCGTLRLEVSKDASGTFSFEFDPVASKLADHHDIPIMPLTFVDLTIEIDPCGNGMIDAAEACDDGISNSDTLPDACRDDCRLPTCGDNVTDSGETCDGTDLGDCPGPCADDCTCLPVRIPTVSTWGLAALTLSLLAAGRVYFGRRSQRRLAP